jgi:hypothetical protein
MSTTHAPTEIVGAKVTPEIKAQLEQLARERERSVSGELRLAINAHLSAHVRDQEEATS